MRWSEKRKRVEREKEGKSREQSRGAKITCTFHAKVIVCNFTMCKLAAATADNVVCTKSRLLKSLVGHIIDLCLVRKNWVSLYATSREQGCVIKNAV